MSTIQNPNGWDVIFSPNSDGSAPYDHEIEPGTINWTVIQNQRSVTGADAVAEVTGHPFLTGSVVQFSASGSSVISVGVYVVTYIDADHFSWNGTSGAIGTDTGGICVGIYAADTGDVSFWVRVPTVSHTANTNFFMFYNKTGVTSSPENINAVWNSNALAIYHFPRGAPFTYSGAVFDSPDSTSNALNLVDQHNGLLQTPGEIQNGIASSGGFSLQNFAFPNLVTVTEYTVMCWMYAVTNFFGNDFLRVKASSGQNIFGLGRDNSSGDAHYDTSIDSPSGPNYLFDISVPLNEWVMLMFVVGLTSVTAYMYNSSGFVASTPVTVVSPSGIVSELDVSSEAGPQYFDELQIWNVGLTAGWLNTTAINQAGGLVTLGAEMGGGASGYAYSRQVSIDFSQVVGGSDLADFPVVITTMLPVAEGPIPQTPDTTNFSISGGSAAYTQGPPPPPIVPSRKCTPII